MTKKELEEKLKNIPKDKYIYQRHNGFITKYIDRVNHYISCDIGIAYEKYDNIFLGKIAEELIDLIEVGDYVNGMLVVSVMEVALGDKGIQEKIVFVNRDEKCTLKPLKITNDEIKSVVTKERFKSMEYKIEAEDK